MSIFQGIIAIFQGWKLCLFNPHIRKLAIWPWGIGTMTSFICLLGAWYLHRPILENIISSPVGILNSFLYGLLWFLLVLVLLIATMVISFIVVMIFAGAFQSSIASEVLRLSEISWDEKANQASSIVKEMSTSLFSELFKLLWLGPIGVILLIIGFFPILAPLAFVGGAWLIAYQFLDVVLEVLGIRVSRRLLFALKNWPQLIAFGITLIAICLLPFVAFLIPPVAVAGAAWLLGRTSWGKEEMRLLVEQTK